MKPQTLTALANALLAAPPMPQPSPLAAKVDRLGLLRAQIDALATEAETIREELQDAGLATVEGTLYKASFAQCQGAKRTDWQAIAQRFKPSPQLVRRHTTTGAPYVALRLTAKTPKH